MSKKRLVRVLPVAVLCLGLLGACSESVDESASSAPVEPPAVLDADAAARAARAISHPAWLRSHLPEHTVAYLRLPSFWGWLAAPNGRALDAAWASEAHTQAIRRLRQALREDPLLTESDLGPALGLLLADLASPLEIAVVDSSDTPGPTSSILATVQLEVDDVADLNARLAALAPQFPLLRAPLDEEGRGELNDMGVLKFDADSQRLFVLTGLTATEDRLNRLMTQSREDGTAALEEVEGELDESGQGAFFWINLEGLGGMARGALPQDPSAALLRDLVSKSASLAGGWGSVDGHGHLQLRLKAPQARILSYLAPTAPSPALKAAGVPQWVASVNLPDEAQWQALLERADIDFGPGTREQIDVFSARIAAGLGTDPQQLLPLLGPALLRFQDDAGTYTALQVRDREALYTRLQQMGEKLGWRWEQLQAGDVEVHHLRLPSLLSDADLADADAQLRPWLRLYQRTGTQLYWLEDGDDWLIFAGLPQMLADRSAARPDADLAAWMQAGAYGADDSLAAVVVATRDMYRQSYYAYLRALQVLLSALDVAADFASLPSASALGLPRDGLAGLALQASGDTLGLRLHYDATPLDLMSGATSFTTVTTAGILAAIAIPAYQDYAVRAQVASVQLGMQPLQDWVTEQYLAAGEFPEDLDDFDFSDGRLFDALRYLDDLWLDDGAITLELGDEAAAVLQGEYLVLTPYQAGDRVVWRCALGPVDDGARPLAEPYYDTSISDKHLPSACR